jgi:hypothetical protein
MKGKIFKVIVYGFYFSVVIYFFISVVYFLSSASGSGDELLFISDLDLIKGKGWIYAIEKNISIPYMILAYPFSMFFENHIALRLVNVLLLGGLFLYFYKQKNKFSISLYGYLLFFISTAGYFYLGTNDTLFFIGLIVFINEVDNLQKTKKWNSAFAFTALIVAFFTRELVIVYSPVIFFCFYIIDKERQWSKIRIDFPLGILLLFLIFNVPSFIERGNIAYDLKNPPATTRATWSQRQYLAQLMVNKGELPNFSHPSWEQTEAYLNKNGEKSLPKGILHGLFFNLKLTIIEFFKDFYFCIFFGFRQLGFMLFIPFFFLAKEIYRSRRINGSMLIPFSLVIMIAVFSLIIISFVEIRWLAPVFVLSIVYYGNLQKNKNITDIMLLLNYGILILMCFYSSFNKLIELLNQ